MQRDCYRIGSTDTRAIKVDQGQTEMHGEGYCNILQCQRAHELILITSRIVIL